MKSEKTLNEILREIRKANGIVDEENEKMKKKQNGE